MSELSNCIEDLGEASIASLKRYAGLPTELISFMRASLLRNDSILSMSCFVQFCDKSLFRNRQVVTHCSS